MTSRAVESAATPTKEEGKSVQVSLDYDELQGDVVPPDDEMYREWISKTINIAKGLRLADPEADAQDVLTDFILNGYHRRWDRTKGRAFDSFCYWMIRNRLLGKLRSQKRRVARDGVPTDLMVTDCFTEVREEYGYDAAEQRADVRALADFLAGVHKQRYGLTPSQLIRAMVDAEEETGQIDTKAVAEDLGVTETTVRQHRSVLRNLLVEMDEANFLTDLLA